MMQGFYLFAPKGVIPKNNSLPALSLDMLNTVVTLIPEVQFTQVKTWRGRSTINFNGLWLAQDNYFNSQIYNIVHYHKLKFSVFEGLAFMIANIRFAHPQYVLGFQTLLLIH